MVRADFIIEYPGTDEALGRKILFHILKERYTRNKPTVVLITGASGEGKSWLCLVIADFFYRELGIDISTKLLDITAFTPFDYIDKFDKFLNDPELKRYPLFVLDDARAILPALEWQSVISKTIADVNALSRGIKPMVLLVCTQYLGDITKAVRTTTTYYINVRRPGHDRPQVRLQKMWLDDSNPETPLLKKRYLKGIVLKDGKEHLIRPRFTVPVPRKELVNQYEEEQRKQKVNIIRNNFEKMVNSLKKEMGIANNKVEDMVKWYMGNHAQLKLMNKCKIKTRFKINDDGRTILNLTNIELKDFERRINEELIKEEKKYVAEKLEIPIQNR